MCACVCVARQDAWTKSQPPWRWTLLSRKGKVVRYDRKTEEGHTQTGRQWQREWTLAISVRRGLWPPRGPSVRVTFIIHIVGFSSKRCGDTTDWRTNTNTPTVHTPSVCDSPPRNILQAAATVDCSDMFYLSSVVVDLSWKQIYNKSILQSKVVPVSTLCLSLQPVSMRFHSSGVWSALGTSWGCTGMKPWFGPMLSPPIPFPEGRCSQSLKGERGGRQIEGGRKG